MRYLFPSHAVTGERFSQETSERITELLVASGWTIKTDDSNLMITKQGRTYQVSHGDWLLFGPNDMLLVTNERLVDKMMTEIMEAPPDLPQVKTARYHRQYARIPWQQGEGINGARPEDVIRVVIERLIELDPELTHYESVLDHLRSALEALRGDALEARFPRQIDPLEHLIDEIYPYAEDHPHRVARLLIGRRERRVALAHDLLENCLTTVERLTEVGISHDELIDILTLTRDNDRESYEEYIQRLLIQGSVEALRVKYADLIDHLMPDAPLTVTELGRHLSALTLIAHELQRRKY